MSAFMVNWLSTRIQRQVNDERIIFSTNDGSSGYPCAKELNWTLTSHSTQKLTVNESKTYKNIYT